MPILLSIGLTEWVIVLMTATLHYISFDVSLKEDNKRDYPAPNFTLPDLHGKSHELSQYEGQYVVLEWLNLRCRTVDRLYRSGTIPKLQKQLDGEAVWLTIASGSTGREQGTLPLPQLTRQIEKRGGEQDAVLVDDLGHVGKLYGVQVVPYFVVIDPEGMIIYTGAFDELPDPEANRDETTLNYIVAALENSKGGEEVKFSTTEPYGCEVRYQR